MKKKLKPQKGITLIALIITIIVMLVLVAVTITVAVNGGLFNFAGKASKETRNSIHAEQELANGRIKIDGLWYDSIDDYLKGIISEDQPSPNDNVKDEHPGELEVIGTDTYEINSIEDLVALAYSVNKSETTYLGKTIELGKNLDFQNDVSYANPETKYVLENINVGYKPDESGTSIKELLLGENGFVPIGINPGVGFYGTINGNYKAIKNMRVKANYFGGLIGATKQGIQEELNVNKLGIQNANIESGSYAGGILGSAYGSSENVNISNCYATGTIKASGFTGGIVGFNYNSNLTINNSYNKAEISESRDAGGVVGGIVNDAGRITNIEINSSYNQGIITALTGYAGGIIGRIEPNSNITINNCYNNETITSTNANAGGILGYINNASKVTIDEAYNKGTITAQGPAGGILGYIPEGTSTDNIEINNIYNEGTITSQGAHAGGILGFAEKISKVTINEAYNNGKITSASGKYAGRNSWICYRNRN